MSHFDKAILEVLKHEGGYCNDCNDPGGETNFGICKRNYPAIDIYALEKTEAIEIYQRDYWRPQYDQMPYEIAAKVFDMSVNMGHKQSHKILQRAAGCVDDGVIGKFTLAAISRTNTGDLLDNITREQKTVYANIIDKRPASKVFWAGWLKRAEWQPPV